MNTNGTSSSRAGAEQPVIEVKDLVKDFGGHVVLRGLNFTVFKGETMVILGGSGSGKSTLLRHLIGALRPTSGSIKIFGEEITRRADHELDPIRQRFGMLFQTGALLASLTVAENIALPIWKHRKGLDDSLVEGMVRSKLEMVGMTGFENHKLAEISGGMKKRVGLARALALDPELLFSDEPTSGLDPIMTAVVDQLTHDLTRRFGMTALVVTHDMTSAFRIGTRMIMLGSGQRSGDIIAHGTPEEIRHHLDPDVQQFIKGEVGAELPLEPNTQFDDTPRENPAKTGGRKA